MKPCASACGRGIQLLNKKSKIKKNINYLACDYIANPHLINNRKYDLRIYVLVNSFDPLKIYMHNEGLVRFCTADYTTNTKKLKEKFIHLTNWSVNKNSPNFIPNEDLQTMDASKWTFTSLKKKFIELGLKVDEIFSRIEDIIIKTLISAEPYMLHSLNRSPEHRNNCFELYGFDILLDSNLKPWLMEVNVCPSLNASSELDRRIKTIVMCDIMNLLGFYPYDKKKYDDD
jgi:tubulin polyglutamylase TTLL4